ncbi:hypothetical protein RUND412_002056 [Rhizina undulata]
MMTAACSLVSLFARSNFCSASEPEPEKSPQLLAPLPGDPSVHLGDLLLPSSPEEFPVPKVEQLT